MTEREFETLVREHRSTIYTVCYMFSTDKDEVADLFQEILINLWRGSGTFRGESALNSWIWKVALNTCISQDRKKRRGLRTEPLSMDIDLFDEQAEDTRQFGLLRERIGKLGPFDRAIVLLWLEARSWESPRGMSPSVLSESRNNSKRCSNMETTDKTFLEMQQQMQQLREKLDSQKIVNERILRRSCGRTIDRLRIKSNAPIVAGLAGLALIPFLHHLGFSPLLLIATGLFMIVGIVATLITKQYIPNLNKDLVTATTELTKFRKINADWYKYGVPFLLVWLGILIWDVVKNLQLGGPELYGFICGASIGLVIGLVLGLKNRRDILDASDDLLAQIEELKG